MAYYDTYRDQLASLYHGHALWVPDPARLYDRVRIGDVGYVKQGHFLRMFNVLLPADDDTQEDGVPEGFVPLNMGPFRNIRTLHLFHGDYCSNTVVVDHGDGRQAAYATSTSALFKCSRRNKGAFLSLPFNGVSEDAMRTKAFETYIRKHCDSWLKFALAKEIDVRLEDIILVTGCDLTSSWAMAAFVNPLDPEISLSVRPTEAGSARFQWTVTNQPHHNEPSEVRQTCLCFLLHQPRGLECREITLCLHQRISRETYSPLFQGVEGRCGASS
ncbi:hypothetical protein BJY52DRAFT_1121208 [Lactarius psammicola]|nr:hypothetical protein BJY52DRAFT_1121208 [Lactarius psammicola]